MTAPITRNPAPNKPTGTDAAPRLRPSRSTGKTMGEPMMNNTDTVACPACGEPVETWFNAPAEVDCVCGATFVATPPEPEIPEKT